MSYLDCKAVVWPRHLTSPCCLEPENGFDDWLLLLGSGFKFGCSGLRVEDVETRLWGQ